MTDIGVIFDVDGTLVDSYASHYESWKISANKDGEDFTWEQFQNVFGLTSREIIELLWNRRVPRHEIQIIDDAKEQAYRDLVSEKFPAMEGATDLLKMLHANGIKIALGSSAPLENVKLSAKLLEVDDILDGLVSGSDVKFTKPDPEIFLTAARQMRIPAKQCVVVEDSTIGMVAAHAASMKCISIVSTGHKIEEYGHADRIIHSLREITLEMIRQLV